MKINESYVLDIISAWFKCALWPAFVFDFYFPCGGKFFLVLKNNKGILCCIFCGVFVNCVIHTFWYSDDIIPYPLCEYESPVEPGTWFSVIEAKNSIHRNNIGCIDNISHILRQFYLYYFPAAGWLCGVNGIAERLCRYSLVCRKESFQGIPGRNSAFRG